MLQSDKFQNLKEEKVPFCSTNIFALKFDYIIKAVTQGYQTQILSRAALAIKNVPRATH